MTLKLVAPKFNNSAQVKLIDHVMRLDKGVHVGLETMLSVDRFLIKFDFDKAIGIGANDKVDLSPVDHNNFLDIVYDIRELARS